MVQNVGKIVKRDFCTKCFTLVQWDEAEDEFSAMGNRYVICPECGSHININDAEIVISNE